MVAVSIIIVTRNTREVLINCLESLFTSPPERSFEVIVVDNGSSDGTKDAVLDHFPDVRLTVNTRNTGFARANNQGAAHASGDFLFLLNSDTTVPAGAIDRLVETLEQNPDTAAVAPQLVYPDGALQDTAAINIHPSVYLSSRYRRIRKDQLRKAIENDENLSGTGYLCGAALMIRKPAFDKIGGMDENLFFYYEDADLCQRLADGGWGIRLVRDIRVMHIRKESTGREGVRPEIEMIRSRLQYMKKHFGNYASAKVGIAFLVERLRRFLVNLLGTLVTLGMVASLRWKFLLHGKVLLWFIVGMPGRDSRVYVRLFGSWQK